MTCGCVSENSGVKHASAKGSGVASIEERIHAGWRLALDSVNEKV